MLDFHRFSRTAKRMVDEGLVLSMGEARHYSMAGMTPERLRELRKRKSQPLRARRDYGSKTSFDNLDDLAFIDLSSGGNFEVRLPGGRITKAETSDDAYALVQKYVEKTGTPLKLIDVPRGLTRRIDEGGNILEGRQAAQVTDHYGRKLETMENRTSREQAEEPKRTVVGALDQIAERLEANGMREAAEKVDVISNTIEAQNWGSNSYRQPYEKLPKPMKS